LHLDPVVIVGASLGGLRAAEALRRSGYLGAIKIIGEEPHPPYNRPPLSKEALATQIDGSALAFPLRESVADVNWLLGRRAVSLDVNLKQVIDDSGEVHSFSALVVATGLRPKQLEIAKSDLTETALGGVHVLRTLDDAISLRGSLLPGANVVIVGSGFIGCEVAATASKLGCSVTVVSSSARPLERVLGGEFAGEIQRRHEGQGVKFIFNSDVTEVAGDAGVSRLSLRGGERLDCDALVVAIGSVANTDWLANSPVDIADGVLTNSAMQALDLNGRVVKDVYAVGDVARFSNPLFDEVARRVEHWNIPTETAKRAAKVIAAGFADGAELENVLSEQFAPLPSFWSDQFDMNILGFGNPALADEVRLLEGDVASEFILGYYQARRLVGIAGLGMKSRIQSYRGHFAVPAS